MLDGGRTVAPAARAACGSYSAGGRRLQCQRAWLQPNSQGIWLFKVGGGRPSLIRFTTGNTTPSSACTRRIDEFGTNGISLTRRTEQVRSRRRSGGGGGHEVLGEEVAANAWRLGFWMDTASRGPTTIGRNHNLGLAQRIMVKRLATSRHDPLGINDSACKNQLVVVSVQYGPFNTYIPIRSTTIGKSRVARDPITMNTSWRSNSDIASVTRLIGRLGRAGRAPRPRSSRTSAALVAHVGRPPAAPTRTGCTTSRMEAPLSLRAGRGGAPHVDAPWRTLARDCAAHVAAACVASRRAISMVAPSAGRPSLRRSSGDVVTADFF
ncbi:beta-galactosidase 6-like [Dorcoceras hygrometricum]|uniref:Beta-galactosidase 6-like n=1 Tax=Dorcoceras hygrometricum TaxID=472368 RepID=A0A2Z7CQ56_9LAMI|nr:beta-galactosidase 6-like [Dorcoceras hygrometricum]